MNKVLESETRIRETGKGTHHPDPKPRRGLDDDIRERDSETVTENSILKTQIETDNENASSI